MSTRSVWGTGSWSPRGHISFLSKSTFWDVCVISLRLGSSLYKHCSAGREKNILSFFSWPDHSLSWHAPALGIGSGMCMGLLTEICTKEAIWALDICQGHFHPPYWWRGLGTTVLLWYGSASWVNDALNSHRLSKLKNAFVQKKKVEINFFSQHTCLSRWFL